MDGYPITTIYNWVDSSTVLSSQEFLMIAVVSVLVSTLTLLSCCTGTRIQQISMANELSHRELHEIQNDPSLPEAHSVHELHPIDMDVVRRRRRRLGSTADVLAPLFPGYGTHYAYAYVGTPPQRQSLIVDTGSHYTAFPCTGCDQCGKHTDPYFNPKNSSSIAIPKCGSQTCPVFQSYTEGSSWRGYKVTDKLWIGSTAVDLLPGADKLSIDFTFACQTSETGNIQSNQLDIHSRFLCFRSIQNTTCRRYYGHVVSRRHITIATIQTESDVLKYLRIVFPRWRWNHDSRRRRPAHSFEEKSLPASVREDAEAPRELVRSDLEGYLVARREIRSQHQHRRVREQIQRRESL